MAKDQSAPPKERVNITYKPAIGDAEEDKELPLKVMVVGDFTQVEDDTPLGERKAVRVDRNNFDDVLEAHDVGVDMVVPDRLSGEAGGELNVKLRFARMKDFEPEAVAQQVPEMRRLLELREALSALKGPLGNVPDFRRKLQALLQDPASREALLRELGIEGREDDGDR